MPQLSGLSDLVSASGAIGGVAAVALGPGARPVRAVYFDKSSAANWALAWHQDRTICVQKRAEVSGYGMWTIKGGIQHVSPPAELLSGMVTLRVHLDAVDEQNAPLLIAPGSHLLDRIAEKDIEHVVARCGIYECHAAPGDVWLYSTLIVHASQRAIQPSRRRVLQIDYAAVALPRPLEWLEMITPN